MVVLYRIPEQLVSDNGPQFLSEEMNQFLATNGVKHIRSAPYHPSTNGAVERLVQTVKHALKSGHQRGVPLEQTLATFLLQYCTTTHATTGVGARVRQQQGCQKKYHDLHSHSREFATCVKDHIGSLNCG